MLGSLSTNQQIIASIVAYSFCSGTMILLNKLTLHFLKFPSLVVAFQLVACVCIIYTAQCLGKITVDKLEWQYIKPYMLYIVFFSSGVYCNMRALSQSNVETVIVFRALTPILVAFLDALFLGREWPSQRSWAGLLTLVAGAYGYASFDEQFQSQGMAAYFWPTCYMVIIALEMAYGKKIVKGVPLKTRSGPVVYTNLLGIVPMMLLATVKNEYGAFWDFYWSGESRLPPLGIFLLLLGSVVGTAIGYSSWWCREMVSATSFTLIGVINKCLTIMLNLLIWDQHADTGGIFCLFVCIAGGMIYQQAPMRGEAKAAALAAKTVHADDDEFKAEISKDEEMQSLRRGISP